jgi:hypothetical protein
MEPGRSERAADRDPLAGLRPTPAKVLVSDALLIHVDTDDLPTGRPRRRKAEGAPRDVHIVAISRS